MQAKLMTLTVLIGLPTLESTGTPTQEVFETQRDKATVRFQRHFMQLLKSAQFKSLPVNDLELTAALNSDYLLTLPIDVDWNSAASAGALLFRRGYATERQEGRLFGAKLDYIQSIFLSKFFNGLTGLLLLHFTNIVNLQHCLLDYCIRDQVFKDMFFGDWTNFHLNELCEFSYKRLLVCHCT